MRILECDCCGLRHTLGDLSPDRTASCRRCGGVLASTPANSLERSLALALMGLILVIVANTMPFMSLNIQGRVQLATLITGDLALFDQGKWELAALVLFTTVLAPAIKLCMICYVLIGLRMRRPPPKLAYVLWLLDYLHPWAMIEVYLLGVFVAYVKLAAFSTIVVGPACYALATLLLAMVALDSILDFDTVWAEVERRGLVAKPTARPGEALLLCETCNLVGPIGSGSHACPRCGAQRHYRKPNSVMRAWALVITAVVLYLPANILPVMTVVSFGSGESDTILSGVKALFLGGMWPLALLVFFASITVPVLKISSLIFLLITTQRGSRWRLKDRTILYRIVEAVGRWSMIDIFMMSILAGLVRLGSIATIDIGTGAIAFAGVVVITMFAASAFDPRLMWDAAGENK